MARAGAQTVLVTINQRPTAAGGGVMNEYRQFSEVPADQVPWKTDLWARMKGMRGGELSIAGGTEANPTVSFEFDRYDVMTPVEGDATGTILHEAMSLRATSEDGIDLGTYDIDRIDPDEESRQTVRVLAIRKTLAV